MPSANLAAARDGAKRRAAPEQPVGIVATKREEDMARTPYSCSLAGAEVQVLVERIILEDQKLRAKHASPELRFCSHVGRGTCPVREVPEKNADVEGWNYSGTNNCEHLMKLRHKA